VPPVVSPGRTRTHIGRILSASKHVIAKLKDWQVLRQCRGGDAINQTLQIIAGLWNLKNHKLLRVNP
jgi:hypothetical protein